MKHSSAGLLAGLVAGLVVVTTSVFTSGTARADVPPPSDYVETCTLEKQCTGGTMCGVFRGETNAECAGAAKAKSMVERCQTWGANTSTAVFCPKDAPVPPPETKKKSGCASCQIGSRSDVDGSLAAIFGGAIVALALARRRQSQWMR